MIKHLWLGEVSIMDAVWDRFLTFWSTSPDELHNRHRLIFFLVCMFLAGIIYELLRASDTNRVELIENFTSTIIGWWEYTWLALR